MLTRDDIPSGYTPGPWRFEWGPEADPSDQDYATVCTGEETP